MTKKRRKERKVTTFQETMVEFTREEEINGSLDWIFPLSTVNNNIIKSVIIKLQRIIKSGGGGGEP